MFKKPNLAVIESDKDFAKSLQQLLLQQEQLCIQCFCHSTSEALEVFYHSTIPDIVIISLSSHEETNIKIELQQLLSLSPELKILVLVPEISNILIEQFLLNGALCLVEKNTVSTKLMGHLENLILHGISLNSRITAFLAEAIRIEIALKPNSLTLLNQLSTLQLKIIGSLIQGDKYENIAKELKLSSDTVRFHVKKIYKKLGIHSRFELKHKISQLKNLELSKTKNE